MALDEVRPRHLVELFTKLRLKNAVAPKTIYNIYGVVKALFRDAQLADLVSESPCILTKHQLGENVDKDPTWRPTAIYTREELETLISDARVPEDRQVLYGIQGLGGLRHGEAAGLRWKHYDPTTPVMGRLIIATSYNKGRTKTKRTRFVPVHPTLAAMLFEWHQRGWPEMMGRPPTAEDLIVPMPAPTNRGRRIEHGRMRTDHNSYKRLMKDLEVLALRHRRGHDLRRTMISLARTDGARRDILELITHNPGKNGSAIDMYTTFPWEALCAEMAKLRVVRRSPTEASSRLQAESQPIQPLSGPPPTLLTSQAPETAKPSAPEGGTEGLATSFATSSRKAEALQGLTACLIT